MNPLLGGSAIGGSTVYVYTHGRMFAASIIGGCKERGRVDVGRLEGERGRVDVGRLEGVRGRVDVGRLEGERKG